MLTFMLIMDLIFVLLAITAGHAVGIGPSSIALVALVAANIMAALVAGVI